MEPTSARDTNPYSAQADAGAAVNPYAPPAADLSPGVGSEAEEVRRRLLSHEASIRAIGTLYLIGFWFLLFASVGTLAVVIAEPTGELMLVASFYALFAMINRFLGKGLRNLDPKVRTGVTILSVIGLLGFPLGTLISAYVLWLIHSEKGKQVLSEGYRQIVEMTPHIRYKTPVWIVVLGLFLLGLLIFAVVATVFA
ncbi:MAG: hypothetical protein MI919_26550 [Holophagales bacterium]|nr:hypothetical protein [Holophagales bacterium]